ncbi:MAG: cysteine desulfurase family protein [Lachnospiraceae bacterium]
MEAYLDNSATTKCAEEVKEIVVRAMTEDYGNPSALHTKGIEAEHYIKEAKQILARTLKVMEKELVFTSGGTESNNLAIIGCAMANQRSGRHIITTEIEHPSVLNPMHYLEELGFRVTYLSVDKYGVISLDELRDAMDSETILVSMMYVNNEIGSVQPIAQAGALIKEINPNTLFHVDGIQAYGKYFIFPKKLGIDLLSVSSHKIHGPKGVGLLYIKERTKIRPQMLGGGQQNDLRSGTENVPGAAGLAVAADLIYGELEQYQEQLYRLRDAFIAALEPLGGVTVNGYLDHRNAPHIVSVSFEGIQSEVLLHSLEEHRVYVSAGSACSSKKLSVSRTLKNIGLSKELLSCTVRFSFSVSTTMEEIDYAIDVLKEIVPVLRKYTRH